MPKAEFFIEANHETDLDQVCRSPSGAYILVIEHFTTGAHTWRYSRGHVLRAVGAHTSETLAVVLRDYDRAPYAWVLRNYDHFPYAWVEGHADGHDYLLCGEDYQGQTVIRLDDPIETVSYKSPEAKRGNAFCWIDIHPAPDGLTLAVDGCVWGGPGDTVFYEFSKPMELPYPKLSEFEVLSETITSGWRDADTYATVEVDAWAEGYDDLADDDDKQPKRERIWRRSTGMVEERRYEAGGSA